MKYNNIKLQEGSKLDRIDYAVVSVDQNPEYKDNLPWIFKRWHQLGIHVLHIDYYICENAPMPLDWDIIHQLNGDITVKFKISSEIARPRVLHRWFGLMISRFWIPCIRELELDDKVLIISDGDLFPINVRHIFQPAYKFPIKELVYSGHLACTSMYAYGDNLATYTYGLGSTFRRLFESEGCIAFDDLLASASETAFQTCKLYMNDEQYMNYLYKKFKPSDGLPTCVNTGNRKWIEMGQEVNNLYDHQIDYLEKPTDLAPFIEFHSFTKSSMPESRWIKLFSLLDDYDKLDICPNNWYWHTVIDPWRDTMITKEGIVLLGDEYDDVK